MVTSIQSVQPSYSLRTQQPPLQTVASDKVSAYLSQSEKARIIKSLDKEISSLKNQRAQAYEQLPKAKNQKEYLSILNKILNIGKALHNKQLEREYWLGQPVDSFAAPTKSREVTTIDKPKESTGSSPLELIKEMVTGVLKGLATSGSLGLKLLGYLGQVAMPFLFKTAVMAPILSLV